MWGLFSNVWSENTALFERLMEIHSRFTKTILCALRVSVCDMIIWIFDENDIVVNFFYEADNYYDVT